jgi:hypothetical protein
MGLDRYGFPAAPLANTILIGLDDFGDSTRQLEQSWYEWLNYYPFDVKVAEKLAGLYEKRLESLDAVKDAGQVHKVGKKLELIKNRAARYGAALFPG